MAPENPIDARTYTPMADCQAPLLIKNKAAVINTPNDVKKNKNCFLADNWSDKIPKKGANSATLNPAKEFANPNRAVLTTTSTPADQYCLKNNGKKPAIMLLQMQNLPNHKTPNIIVI